MHTVTLWVLFSIASGLPVPQPHSFINQSTCSAAASTYMRLSKTHEQFRCEPFADSVVFDRETSR